MAVEALLPPAVFIAEATKDDVDLNNLAAARRKSLKKRGSVHSNSNNNELSYLISRGLEIEFVEGNRAAEGNSEGDAFVLSPRGPLDYDSNIDYDSNTRSGRSKDDDDDELDENDNGAATKPAATALQPMPTLVQLQPTSPPSLRRSTGTPDAAAAAAVLPFVLQREVSELDVNLSSSFSSDDDEQKQGSGESKEEHAFDHAGKNQHDMSCGSIFWSTAEASSVASSIINHDGDDDDPHHLSFHHHHHEDDEVSHSSSWSLDSSFADVRSESGEDTYFSQSFDYETAAASTLASRTSNTTSATSRAAQSTVVMNNTSHMSSPVVNSNPTRRYYFFNDQSYERSSYEKRRKRRSSSPISLPLHSLTSNQDKEERSPLNKKKFLLTPMEALRWFDEDQNDDDDKVDLSHHSKASPSTGSGRNVIIYEDSREEDDKLGLLLRYTSTASSLNEDCKDQREHRKNNLSQHSWFSAVDEVIHEQDEYENDDDEEEEESSSLPIIQTSSSSSEEEGKEQEDIFTSCRSVPLIQHRHTDQPSLSATLLKRDNINGLKVHDKEEENVNQESSDDDGSHLNGISLEDFMDDEDGMLSYSTAASSQLWYDDDDDDDDEPYDGDEDLVKGRRHSLRGRRHMKQKQHHFLLPPSSSSNNSNRRPWSAPSRVGSSRGADSSSVPARTERNKLFSSANDMDLLKQNKKTNKQQRNIFQCLFCPPGMMFR